jgi:L-ribulose-5-phosphate 3-epimerase
MPLADGKPMPLPNLDCIPLGIYEKALPQNLSWPERLETARQLGYEHVELSIDETDERIDRLDWEPKKRAALRQAMLDAGMPIRSMCVSAHRRFPLGSASEAVRQTGLDILKKAIDFAVDTGLRLIMTAGADVYYEDSNEESRARFMEGLERGLEWASAAGVMLALENWDVPLYGSLRKMMELVRYFHSPWLQLYVDIGNLAFMGHDVVLELEAARGHIAAVHIKDTKPCQLRYVALGRGTVPFVPAFAKLAEIGFYGPMVLELWTENEPDALQTAAEAGHLVRHWMQQGWETCREQMG